MMNTIDLTFTLFMTGMAIVSFGCLIFAWVLLNRVERKCDEWRQEIEQAKRDIEEGRK